MQDTAMDDLEMDEMFDKHLEEHEAPFDDDQATGRSNAVPAHVQQRHSQFDDVDDDDASMGRPRELRRGRVRAWFIIDAASLDPATK